MKPSDTVDRTIRNHRCRTWPWFAWLVGWFVFWSGFALTVDRQLPPPPNFLLVGAFFAGSIASFIAFLIVFGRYEPVKRLKLGDDLRAIPAAHCAPSYIRLISFAHDPLEDYVENKLPIRMCEVTIERRRGRRLKLIVSTGDAARLREWAEGKGVVVEDPMGYATDNGQIASADPDPAVGQFPT